MLYSILVSLDVIIAAALIGLVLLQQGKGANAGAAFGGGGGASGTVFGARGSSSFMSRSTAILAAAFFINSIVLAYLASNRVTGQSVIDSSVVQEQQTALPVVPEEPGDIPGTIDLPEGTISIPEGTSAQGMTDLIEDAIQKQVQQPSVPSTQLNIPEDATSAIEEATKDSAAADIP